MKNLLFITSSAQGERSYSNWLSSAVLKKITEAHPGIHLLTYDLAKNPLPHLDEATIAAFFTPDEFQTPEHKVVLANSTNAIDQLMNADIILIGVSMYNFGISSTLKSWIDHIARAGITFTFNAAGVEGLVKNKKVYLAIASGGIYSDGPTKALDFTEPYLRAELNFLGMTDITVFRIEGTNISDLKDIALTKAEEQINHFDFKDSDAA